MALWEGLLHYEVAPIISLLLFAFLSSAFLFFWVPRPGEESVPLMVEVSQIDPLLFRNIDIVLTVLLVCNLFAPIPFRAW